MAQVIASVSSINGVFYVKHPDGSLVELSDGDKIYEGDIVVGKDSNNAMENIILALQDGSEMIMVGSEEQMFDTSLAQEAFAPQDTVTDANALSLLAEMQKEEQENDGNSVSRDDDNTKIDENTDMLHSNDSSLDERFQQIHLENTDIQTSLNKLSLNQEENLNFLQNTRDSGAFLEEERLLDMLRDNQVNVTKLTQIANDAAIVANTAAQITFNTVQVATANPTSENLAAVANAQIVANDAATIAINAANTLEVAINTLNTVAGEAGETVDITAAQNVLSLANDAATTATEAVTASEELTSSQTEDPIVDSSLSTDESDNINLEDDSDYGTERIYDALGGDDTVYGGEANDIINGGEGSDEIYAGAGDDTIIFDVNDVVDGGTGFDTLLAMDNDINIDLSSIEDKISNIEAINLNDGNNELTGINFENIVNLTDDDNILRIDGTENDTIVFDTEDDETEWELGDFKTDSETGNSYQEYTATNDDVSVTIEVNANIHVDES